MKKLLSIFLIMLCFSGCKQNNDSELIKTEAVEAQQTAFVEKEGEVLVPESLRTVQLPIVGDSRVIVIDAGHQRRGDSNKEPIGPGASQTKAKVTTEASGTENYVEENAGISEEETVAAKGPTASEEDEWLYSQPRRFAKKPAHEQED